MEEFTRLPSSRPRFEPILCKHIGSTPGQGKQWNPSNPNDGRITYRSGVAARLAGLSPETLRVWERRYNLSDVERSARGQRLYSA
ncbi:hypothetical protein CTI14_33225, partial [Methylobacterium radiotolerans]